MNKNTMKKEYPVVNSGLSKLAKEDAARKGYIFTTKAQKLKKKALSNSK